MSIDIHEGVTYIGPDVFSGCNSLTINCKLKSKPDEWDSAWNSDNRPVNWGYID